MAALDSSSPPDDDGGATSTIPPEVGEIHPALLPEYVRNIRRPCVLRGIGSDLELTTGLRQGAPPSVNSKTTKNKSEAEEGNGVNEGCDDHGNGTGKEVAGDVGGGLGLEDLWWLARQTGEVKFRVFVNGALTVAAEERGGCDDKQDVVSASGRDSLASATAEPDSTTNATLAAISVATFTLDGTDHPDSILTTSMSLPMTLAEMISCGSEWRSRYLVEDDLPPPTGSSLSFGRLVPATPPLPPDVLAASFGNSGSGADAAPPAARQRQLFASVGPCRTQVHRDCFDNVYVCASGERRWSLAPPYDGWEREAGSVSASVAPPPSMSPGCEVGVGDGVAFAHTSLRAGDGIFVPASWWHSVRSGNHVSSDRGGHVCSVALNWYYDPPHGKHSSNAHDESKRKRTKTTTPRSIIPPG